MQDRHELAIRHVFEARRIVARQKRLVADLKTRGRNTWDAERTLELFERTLRIFEDDLVDSRLDGEVPGSPPPQPSPPALESPTSPESVAELQGCGPADPPLPGIKDAP